MQNYNGWPLWASVGSQLYAVRSLLCCFHVCSLLLAKMHCICIIHHLFAIQSLFKDYLMALFVLCLAIIDIVILLTYTVTEAVRDNLGVKLTTSRELPEETFGV